MQAARSIELDQWDIDYFKRGEYEIPRFWARLGGKPDLSNAHIVDIGCGHGSLCIDLALSGAKKVLGLDIDAHLIEFANENLRRNYPQLKSVLEFRNVDLRDYPELEFEVAVSKDTFEHIMDLEGMLGAISSRLQPGGRIYAGFGPLYNAPSGDHGRTHTPTLWGHLLVPEQTIFERLNRHRKTTISSVHDLGLNGMSLQDYKRAFRESGLSVEYFRVNQGALGPWPHQLVYAFASLLRKIPFLEEYFTINIYCILEKR